MLVSTALFLQRSVHKALQTSLKRAGEICQRWLLFQLTLYSGADSWRLKFWLISFPFTINIFFSPWRSPRKLMALGSTGYSNVVSKYARRLWLLISPWVFSSVWTLLKGWTKAQGFREPITDVFTEMNSSVLWSVFWSLHRQTNNLSGSFACVMNLGSLPK